MNDMNLSPRLKGMMILPRVNNLYKMQEITTEEKKYIISLVEKYMSTGDSTELLAFLTQLNLTYGENDVREITALI